MTQAERDKKAYDLAWQFLLSLSSKSHRITRDNIEKHTTPLAQSQRPSTVSGIFQRLLDSAQNAQMKTNVIGRAIGGIDKLAGVLDNFNPHGVEREYGLDAARLLGDVKRLLKPKGKVNEGPRALWPKYCTTMLRAAAFLTRFESAPDFYAWVDRFYTDAKTVIAAPIILHFEIPGLGFALACDFLKELGYANYAKPDVHLKYIFPKLGLAVSKGDLDVFRAEVRVAEHCDTTPYTVDKLFWLIGSGDFYNAPEVGRIGRHREEFVQFAKEKLSEAEA
jgi:hypothetical protein